MSSAVFWAIVAAVLAIRLTPLWGILVGIVAAVIGTVSTLAPMAASGAVLAGAVGSDAGLAKLARTVCFVILSACVVGTILLANMITTGRAPLSRR